MHSKRHTTNKFTQTHEQHKMNGETEIAPPFKGKQINDGVDGEGLQNNNNNNSHSCKENSRTKQRTSGGCFEEAQLMQVKGRRAEEAPDPVSDAASLPPSSASRPESLRVSTCPPACSDRGGGGGGGGLWGEARLEKGSQGTHRSACL